MANRIRTQVDLSPIKELIEFLQSINKKLSKKTADKIGEAVVKEMKRLIAKGESPITGRGVQKQFRPYKNPDKYPGKRKPHKPVNLKLTGEFLDSLGVVNSNTRGKSGAYVPIVGYLDSEQQLKEIGHATGHKGQPKRPTIPGTDQKFRKEVLEVAENLLSDEIIKILETL